MVTKPPILIPYAAGTNRDGDALLAVELAGGEPILVSMKALRENKKTFGEHAGVLLPGGFSYGDALGAGQKLALELRHFFAQELAELVSAGKPVLGICNGFQALVKAGLLPSSPENGSAHNERQVTLAHNKSGNFECRWVTLRVASTMCRSWLSPIQGSLIRCPVAHGEGRLMTTSDTATTALFKNGLVAFTYLENGAAESSSEDVKEAQGSYPANPNGSVGDIAGICDHSGAVVGLMPHPENHVMGWQCPNRGAGFSGLPLFETFVEAAR